MLEHLLAARNQEDDEGIKLTAKKKSRASLTQENTLRKYKP